jgi:hypothetical protein
MVRVASVLGCILICTTFLAAQWVQTGGPEGGYIQCFAVSGTTVCAGTYGGGAFISPDGGSTWSVVNSGLNNRYLNQLLASGASFYAATNGGVSCEHSCGK